MTQRTFLLPSLTLALLTGAIGCDNAAKPVSPASSFLPTPAAQTQKPAPTPSTSALAGGVPIATIQVKPPASFSPDRIPQDGRAAFSVPGNAGDFLVVKVNEVTNPAYESTLPHVAPERGYSISIRAADDSSAKALQEGGGCTDKSVYLLSQTGTYNVVFDPSQGRRRGRKYGIGFTLLTKNDPVVDSGIKPEEISIDFGAFAKSEQLHEVPAALVEGCLNDSWPSHLAVWNARFQFRIMQVAGYKKVFPSDPGMALLEAAIAAGKTDSVAELPYASSADVGLNMWARQEILEGDGWRGFRWIGGYGQDTACRPDLRYVFEGISKDGRFLIVIRAAISHPATQQRWARECASDAEVPRIDALLTQDLTAATPASFQPSLDQLDAVVRSLKFKY